MRVALVAWGSRGDYQPYLALAVGLARAGHEVRVGAPQAPGFEEAAAEQQISFAPLGPAVDEDTIRAVGEHAWRTKKPLDYLRVAIDELLVPRLEPMYEDCLTLGRWADVLVSDSIQPAGRMAAETLGCPFATGTQGGTGIPTDYWPPHGLPNLGRRLNRQMWRFVAQKIDAVWASGINPVRQRVGLSPLRDLTFDGFYSPSLNLVAVSRQVASVPPDWAPRHRVSGYWFLEPAAWSAPPDLVDWLEGEAKPIAIGFGSLVDPDPAALTHLILKAVEQSGVRAIVEPGRTMVDTMPLTPSVRIATGVPHAWLLPRVAALVHHGGAGTTAAAFRAGIPSVFVPFVGDQFSWGACAARLGVAPPPTPRNGLTTSKLAHAIRVATTEPGMIDRAAELGGVIRAEDGVSEAVRLLEELALGRSVR